MKKLCGVHYIEYSSLHTGGRVLNRKNSPELVSGGGRSPKRSIRYNY